MAECRECELAAVEKRAVEGETQRLRELIENYGRMHRKEGMIGSCFVTLVLIMGGHFLGSPGKSQGPPWEFW
jgi:hypothetical protein